MRNGTDGVEPDRAEPDWAETERFAARLGERLGAFWNEGDREAVTDPDALAEATALRMSVLRVPDEPGETQGEAAGPHQPLYVLDQSVLYVVACLHYARCVALGPGTDEALPDARMTFGLFALVARFAPEEVPADIRDAVAAMDVPESRDLATLWERALELFGRWQTAGDAEALEGATAIWRGLRGVLPASHPVRPMLLANLCGALRNRCAALGDFTDLEEAVDMGRQAVRTAPADDPDRALYLSNLSAALFVRSGVHGIPADLDDAVTHGTASVRAAREPHALFHSNAGMALLARYERDAAVPDLEAAVDALRHAERRSAPDDPLRAMYLTNLGLALDQRFLRLGDRADLDAAVDAATRAVTACPPGHAEHRRCLANLSGVLRSRADHSRAAADLDAAVDAARRALADTPGTPGGGEDPHRDLFLGVLGKALRLRFTHLGARADIDESVGLLRRAAPGPGDDSAFTAVRLHDLGGALLTRFRRTGDPADADAAVEAARRSVRATPVARADRGVPLSLLGEALLERARWIRSPSDEEEAATVLEEARGLLAGFQPVALRKCLSELGRARTRRFDRTASLADLDAALDAYRDAVGQSPDDPERIIDESHIGGLLLERFALTGDQDDLTEALDRHRRAARSLVGGEDDRNAPQVLFNLGRALQAAYEQNGDLALLDEAVRRMEEAGRSTRQPGPDRAMRLSGLGAVLRVRAERLGTDADRDRAVELSRQAVDALPTDHPERATYLSNLSTTLLARYIRSGAQQDLEESVRASRQAVEATPESDAPERVVHLANLGIALRRRYEWSGALADLDEAIDVAGAAVRGLPAGHVTGHLLLTNLSTALTTRYERTGDLAHLDEAIEASRAAVRAVPEGHPSRVVHLSNLGNSLRQRYGSTRRRADADEAVACLRQAVDGCPEGHPSRAVGLSNLSGALLARIDDGQLLARATEAAETSEATEATEATEAAEANKPAEASGAADADEAAITARAAVRAVPDGHPQRAKYLSNLGAALLVRASLGGSLGDIGMAFDLFRQATGITTAPALVRFRAARAWGRAAAGLGDWREALDAHRAAVAELPLLAWHGLAREDRLDALGRAAGLAGDAAAVALNAGRPQEALQLLEQGRGVLLAQALDARDDMTALRERAPGLAARVREVRALLDADAPAASLPDPAETGTDPARAVREQRAAAERHRGLAREMDELVRRARELPGMEDFLRLPSVERLREAAGNGPVVVVNTSALRCDALVVTRDGLRAVPLPELALTGPGGLEERTGALLDALASAGGSPAEAWRAQRTLVRTLGWLWDAVAAPVLAELGEAPKNAGQRPPRLWWCPTGLLALLPLHAAGHYGPGATGNDGSDGADRTDGIGRARATGAVGGGPRALPDRYVCSYTTTLRALAAQTASGSGPGGASGPGGGGGTGGPGREGEGSGANGNGRPDGGASARGASRPGRMLAVDQSDTPGLPPLPHARAEVRLLSGRVPRTTILAGRRATRAAVLDALPAHSFLHFSGHGGQNPQDPAGGALYCHDHERSGPLTVADISRLSLGHARLAFLSACETARGATRLPDEAVHLAGALQLAGFAHVVAAQWAVDDESALRAAEDFYAGLAPPRSPGGPGEPGDLDPDRAANALHGAVQRLRQRDDDPLWWAAYVHTGP
ncbi:CHAT domain-containing protein [Streptomyces albireticuli]|uniref:CHAT domain-containing protein n=1 Tax=Streptomyces albireticuli TaxID=1940 RepID=UPI0036B9EB5B